MSRLDVHACRVGSECVLVLLPGAYMKAADFLEAGFARAVKDSGIALDVQLVDIDLTATAPAQARAAVNEQVLVPARQTYRRLLLGGISLGGQAALLHAAHAQVAIDGLCLLAPYPGSRLALNAIGQQGGLDHWKASPDQLGDPDYQVWQWLQQPTKGLPVFLGYGEEDRFADGMHRIGERLPAGSTCVVPGGHDWAAWKSLWSVFLARGAFVH